MWIAAWFGLSWASEVFGPLVEDGFWSDLLEWATLAGILIASFLLFPAVVGLVLGVFLEEVAGAVERRHYPGLPAPRPQPVVAAIGGAAGFAATAILLNLLALPLYLVLLFIPPFNLFVFYGLNGYLFGREYFELVAVRRLDPAAVRRLRRTYRGRLLLAGMIIALLLTLPLINLIAPIIATGFMVHVFEDLRRRENLTTGSVT